MCRSAWTIIFLNFLALATFSPVYRKRISAEAETSLERFLNYYLDHEDKSMTDDGLYETMQGDEPRQQNVINPIGYGDNRNFTIEYSRAMRNRNRPNDLDERSRENRIQELKYTILNYIGRYPEENSPSTSLNISAVIPNITGIFNDDQITEKIRSFYPSCEIPLNTDQDVWKDNETMNLFFNFDFFTDSRNTNIATATLRLYRLPENGTKSINKPDCENLTSSEEDKLLRVSIYWYTKSLKKKRVKRRLSDSKVIPETVRWVELSVKPAAKAWARGKNLGIGILVEDQEGNKLKADRIFKGASCTVGISTPKPIPTIILDAARKTNELDRIHNLLGENSTSTIYSDVLLLPTIDICTLEFGDNYTFHQNIKSRINACNLKKTYDQNQLLAEKDRLERIATLPDLVMPSNRHIRHQRQHMVAKDGDGNYDNIRNRIIGYKVVLRHEDIQNLTNNFNFSMINR